MEGLWRPWGLESSLVLTHTHPPSMVKDLLLEGPKEILLGITPEATAPFLGSLEVTLV